MRKRWLQSALAIVLAVTMCLGLAPLGGIGGVFKAAETWEDTGLLKNGNFELEDINVWNFDSIYKPWIKVDDGVNKTRVLMYTDGSKADDESFSMSQTVENLEAGTYRFSFQMMGEVKSNGLSISVNGEEAKKLQDTNGWNNWVDVTSEEVTLEDGQNITITISGTIPKDYWGYFDNFKLEKKTADAQEPEEKAEYKVTVTPSATTVEAGDTVTFKAEVTKNGEPVKDLNEENLSLWMYEVDWIQETPTPGDSGIKEIVEETKGKSLTVATTLETVGTYHFEANLQVTGETTSLGKCQFDVTVTEPKSQIVDDINVQKISNLREDFIMGMDISSIISEFDSGVVYKKYNGDIINNVTDFCKFVASQGITHIRVRVWNDPYDSSHNGYGGGNNDVEKAKLIADGCRAAGIKMLVDFHCSDLWTDPGKQFAPKAWQNYTLDQKKAELKKFIQTSLETIDPKHDTVTMVQVGNETTGGFIGETEVANMCALFQSGSEGVKAYDQDVQVVIHVTNPESGNVTTWAQNLFDNNVNYDILATSYYPYWHGTLANLASEFEKVRSTYKKEVMVAETSYAYTLEDSDGHTNTVRVGNNDTGGNTTEPFSEQGQATAIRNLMNTVNAAGGLGVFYWEPAWITVGNVKGLTGYAYADQVAENKAKWEKYGSGWASSYAGSYDPDDAGKWYGGSAVDNEAFFYPDGTPTPALHVWNYVKTGAASKYTTVESIGSASQTINIGEEYKLPETIEVKYDKITVEEPVEWNENDIAKIDKTTIGTYVVKGTVTFSKTVDNGKYNGKTKGETTYTLVVKQKNLIEDTEAASFRTDDRTLFDVSEWIKVLQSVEVASPASDHKSYDTAGGCVHWYNGNKETESETGTVTYTPLISLPAGKYTFEAVAQGYKGEKDKDGKDIQPDSVSLKVLDENGNQLFASEAVKLEGYDIWKTLTVDFELEETTEVKLQIVIKSSTGGWGTADMLYLHEAAEQPESGTDKPAEESKPEVTTDVEEGAPETSLSDTVVQELQEAGILASNESVILHVESKDEQDVPPQEMEKVTAVLEESGFDHIGAFIDLNLYKMINNAISDKLTDLTEAIEVTIVVPENLRNISSNVTRTFAIIRLHDGVAELINANSYDPKTGELSFSTDAFSIYAIVYKDEEVAGGNPLPNPQPSPNPTPSTPDNAGGADTGDNTPILPFAVLLFAAAGVVVVTAVRRRKAK